MHIGPSPSVASSVLKRQRLLSDEMVCVVREDHPALGRGGGRRLPKLSLETYTGLGHIMVGVGKRGPTTVDRELAERGTRRRIVCRVPHFVAALTIVGETDLVLTVPRRLAARLGRGHGLTLCRTPLSKMPFQYAQFWSPIYHADPGHRWFRAQALSAARRA
ncbi:MAG TPA: hypothetical protein ENK57_17265 [Polyangiaceae bacterium]|nr:hypothetical protein [Polyangiaceae bacterium]